MKNIADILPIYQIEQDIILSKMGDMTVGFKLLLPEIFSLNADEYEAFHHGWTKAIKILPVNAVLHKQDWFTEDKYTANYSDDVSFLSRSSERFFQDRPYLDHNCYLFLSLRPVNRKFSGSMFSTLLRKHIVPVETLDEKWLAEFLVAVSQFEAILTQTGFIACERLQSAQLTALVLQYLNLGNDQVLRDISFKEHIQVGEKYCELFTMADATDMPGVCGPRITFDPYSTDRTKFSVGFASSVGQLLSCNHIYNQYLFLEDPVATTKQMEARRLRLQSLSAYSRNNLLAKESTDLFLNEALSGDRLPVKGHFNLLSWTDDYDKLSSIRNLCSVALSEMDVRPKIERVGAPQIYWAGIPGNAPDMPVNETFDTFSHQGACFFNLETNYLSSASPIGVRLGDRISGKPVHVDLSDELMDRGLVTNRNKLFIGPSGSGKSFLMNHMLKSYFENGSHIVVVDVGHSYSGLCALVKGTYFTYSETEPIRFNPFHIESGLFPDTEKKESLKTLLLALWKKNDEVYNRSEYVALSNALHLYYEKEFAIRDFNSFYDFLKTEFVESLRDQSVKDKDFDVSNFLYVLQPFYRGGEFDYLLNAKENLDLLHQPFIVFELDNIKDHPILFPVVTIILIDVFISKMRKLEGIRKILLLEEVWKALSKKGMEEAIQYWVKTIRKYFGELWPASQEIEDMIASGIVKNAIINNCDCKILLDQSKYQNKFSQIQELLGFSDKQAEKILSINKANDPLKRYKEAYFSPVGKVYRIEVSPEEYFTYTTEQSEKLKVKNAAKKYNSMEKGISSLIENE